MNSTSGAVLCAADIRELLKARPPLLEGLVSLDEQIQPNGVDLTVRDVAVFSTPGRVGLSNEHRIISTANPLAFNKLGFINLSPGEYLITFNEIVHLPRDIMALAKPRSSLLRCGVTIHNAVWDAGYEGRSQALMVVYNKGGFEMEKNSRVLQLVFFRLTRPGEGYRGVFQGENS